ncbi:DUF302 domain-containing protein [Spirochaeta africana]|uniref:DUF302 domain-containing protein n=1 Tax=Spirochaeta africana (strain ATCC 700263 / DSM 8902 / Z-7692) TaxID=889378 RepID=H9UMH9_SPIAZ|nr:DUF302 domain-containing protein [Spirochaeta africana]AFG38722.1 hypothetical protein Spiaf_2697 [Spirochaeta africana DSM 8902]
MNKITVMVGAGALVVGAAVALVIGFFSMPGMMMLEDESPYDFATTIERFEQEVAAGGWSVLTVHDMQAVLDGHGHQVDAIKIYELCSSQYSAEILVLDDERIISPLMPCRVSIYEKSNGRTYISRMNSELMARPFGGVINEVMQVAAVETEVVISRVLDS